MIYTPIFDLECADCTTAPQVGIILPNGGIRATGYCGSCFFQDRIMLDWDMWNQPMEATE